jgi:hypothetical protein
MTEDTARRVANALLGAAVVGVGYYVVRSPPLRRLAWRLAISALTVSIPAWVSGEVREAWSVSGSGHARREPPIR